MTLRYKLRTLLILLAILPPLLWIGWGEYQAWRAEQARQRLLRVPDGGAVLLSWPMLVAVPPIAVPEEPRE